MKRVGETMIVIGLILFLIGVMMPNSQTSIQADPPAQVSFLYFGAEWCQPCGRMKREVLENPKVKAALKDLCGLYVTIMDVDLVKGLAIEYKVVSVPTYMVLRDGVVVQRAEGYRSVGSFLQWLKGD